MINEQGLNVRVLNIDSRKRSSGTAQDCEITLGAAITLPAGAVAWVTAVSVPFAWPTTSSLNNKIYVTEHITNHDDVVPHVGAAGDWTYSSGVVYAWTKTPHVSHTFQYTAGSETRFITFTEWTQNSVTIKMTETRPGTTIHYTYDRATNTFSGVGANVTWVPVNNAAPFYVQGEYPVTHVPEPSTSNEVVEITPATYNAAAFGQAVANALSSKTSSILPKPVTYHATVNNQVCTLALRFNEAIHRYDFQGMWNRTGPGAGNGPKQVVRDYRHHNVSTTFPEYVVSPQYDFSGLGFKVVIDPGDNTGVYTGTVAAGTGAWPAGKLTLNEPSGWVGDLEFAAYPDFLHHGGHPAFHVSYTQPDGGFFSTMADNTDAGYKARSRTFKEFTLNYDTFHISFDGDPVITSQETPLLAGDPVGLSFSSSGAIIRDITGLGNLMTTAVVTSPASITFPSIPNVQFSKDVVHTLGLGCSFELPSEMSLVPNRTNTQSINQRLGNMNSGNPLRSGQKNTNLDKGAFTSTITTPHLGDSIYLCSSLTSNAGLLPSGFPGAVARIPITNFDPFDDIWYQEGTYHNMIDVGGRTLTSLHFSLRDHSGNLIPLDEGHERSAQIQFGFPEK